MSRKRQVHEFEGVMQKRMTAGAYTLTRRNAAMRSIYCEQYSRDLGEAGVQKAWPFCVSTHVVSQSTVVMPNNCNLLTANRLGTTKGQNTQLRAMLSSLLPELSQSQPTRG